MVVKIGPDNPRVENDINASSVKIIPLIITGKITA